MTRSTLPSGRAVELARPADGRPATQGLVLIPDIMDLRPLFDAHSQRLADEHGWAVANVEIWHGHQELDLEARLQSVGILDDTALLADLGAAADLLDVEPVGVAGFCMGGMYALKAAGTGRFHRAVAFYGMFRVPPHWQGPTTVEPLDQVARPGASPDARHLRLDRPVDTGGGHRGGGGRRGDRRDLRGRRPRLRPRRLAPHPPRRRRRRRLATSHRLPDDLAVTTFRREAGIR